MAEDGEGRKMKAMVFAAGLGTRLRPLTDTRPKALVEVDGKPLIWHVLRKLKNAGIDSVVVNVHHFAGMLEDYLKEAAVELSMEIEVSDESACLLDTGGGIRHARAFLENSSREHLFLVHNVDILSSLDVKDFEKRHVTGSLATLAVSDRSTRRYLLFDDDMRLVGWSDAVTGEVKTPYRNLDSGSCYRYPFSGIHLVSDDIFRVFDEVDAHPEAFPLYRITKSAGPLETKISKDGTICSFLSSLSFDMNSGIEAVDMEAAVLPDGTSDISAKKARAGESGPLGTVFPIVDFYLRVCARYPVYGYVPSGFKMMDVGKIASLPDAEAFLRSLGDKAY